MVSHISIATRKSPLALWQANFIRDQIMRLNPDLEVSLLEMSTRGDKILDTPLAKIGGKGLFVKELEVALLDQRADIAVHSMKDVPMAFPEGLELGAICKRESPFDAFVSNRFGSIDELPQGSVVGTSSLRRASQLKALRPDLKIESLRGNVNTRLSRLDEGMFDAIILAASGLIRLGFEKRIQSTIQAENILPAVGQGALGIETRVGDIEVNNIVSQLADYESSQCVKAERAMNQRLEGGCQVPIAGFAEYHQGKLSMRGLVANESGTKVLTSNLVGDVLEAEEIGKNIAEDLLRQGAKSILEAIYKNQEN